MVSAGVLSYISWSATEVQKYILEGQMTTFKAFPKNFYVFQRWSKGQTKVVGGPELACRLPVENLWVSVIMIATDNIK